jgi:glycosyltransferase involved in cell wall biosynthesis
VDNAAGTQAEGLVPEEASYPRTANQTQPLRVAGVDPERGFSGGETQVMGLTLELQRMGHRAEIICDPEGELSRRADAAGVVCSPLRIRNSVDIAAGLRLRGLIRRVRYDVVHFHTARAHALAPYTQGLDALRIVTRRMDYPPNRIFGPYLYNRAVDGVIAISTGVAEALANRGSAPPNLRVIPSGVDCDRFAPPSAAERTEARARLGLRPPDVAVGAVGALTLRKGHRFLIDAIARARAAGARELRGFIAGAGPLATELAIHARESGGDDPVRMLGALADPRSLLWALDIFAMPSLQEGLGVAALEAMACGLPVIASNVGGLREVVREVVDDGASGLLIGPADARALAQALSGLAREPVERSAMGAAARRRALARFSMAAMAARTLDFYLAMRVAHRPAESRRTG